MIAKLTGLFDSSGDGFLILDVNGVGYRVFCSTKTLMKMPAKGQPASLLIETQVREDHIHLFGFADVTEKTWFNLLTTVQGVGAKVGLAILSALSADELSLAIASGDSKALSRANGVGPKLAIRLVTELKGKGIGNLSFAGSDTASGEIASNDNTLIQEALSALVNLGYTRMDAMRAVGIASKKLGQNASVGDLIKTALKEISV